MLKVQEFIRSHKDWEQHLSTAPYYIKIKHITEKKNGHDLVLLDYNHAMSQNCFIVNECRGLVLDITDNCSVVRYGFYRFYNLGEDGAADIGNHISTTEKVDGSLIFIYNYLGHWRIGTRSIFCLNKDNPNNEQNLRKIRLMYRQIMSYITTKAEWTFNDLDPDCTYCFEFVSPDFQIIVPYKEVDMYFLMCRNNKTLQEVETTIPFKRPKTFEFNNLSDIENYVSQFKASEFEGVVVKDEHNNRVKIKNLNWLKTHYLYHNGQFSDRYFLHLYFENDYEELLSYFPNLREQFDKVVEHYNKVKQTAKILDDACLDELMTKKHLFDIVNRTVKQRGFQMLVFKSYTHYAYDWFCKLDEYWYVNYFIEEDEDA